MKKNKLGLVFLVGSLLAVSLVACDEYTLNQGDNNDNNLVVSGDNQNNTDNGNLPVEELSEFEFKNTLYDENLVKDDDYQKVQILNDKQTINIKHMFNGAEEEVNLKIIGIDSNIKSIRISKGTFQGPKYHITALSDKGEIFEGYVILDGFPTEEIEFIKKDLVENVVGIDSFINGYSDWCVICKLESGKIIYRDSHTNTIVEYNKNREQYIKSALENLKFGAYNLVSIKEIESGKDIAFSKILEKNVNLRFESMTRTSAWGEVIAEIFTLDENGLENPNAVGEILFKNVIVDNKVDITNYNEFNYLFTHYSSSGDENVVIKSQIIDGKATFKISYLEKYELEFEFDEDNNIDLDLD